MALETPHGMLGHHAESSHRVPVLLVISIAFLDQFSICRRGCCLPGAPGCAVCGNESIARKCGKLARNFCLRPNWKAGWGDFLLYLAVLL